MDVVHQCVALLPTLYDTCQQGDWGSAKEIQSEISALESEADRLKRKVQLKLHGDLFLPVPRSDILSLLQVQDNIANQVEDIAGLLVGRRMVFPKPLAEPMFNLLAHMLKTCHKAAEVSSELGDLLEAGFDGIVVKLIKDMVRDLDLLEQQADVLQAQVRQQIFEIEADHAAVDVFFWYDFVSQNHHF